MSRINKPIPNKIISLKGKTTDELLSMDVYKLNKASLKAVLKRLVNTANSRLARLEKNKMERYSPSYRKISEERADEWIESGEEKKVRFSTKGKTRNEIEMQVKKVKSFLQSESSTIKGVTKQREDIKLELGEFESIEQENNFWDLYHKWIKTHKNINARFNDSFQVRDMLYDYYIAQGKTERGASSRLTRAIKKIMGDIEKAESDNARVLENALKSGERLNVFKPKNNLKPE